MPCHTKCETNYSEADTCLPWRAQLHMVRGPTLFSGLFIGLINISIPLLILPNVRILKINNIQKKPGALTPDFSKTINLDVLFYLPNQKGHLLKYKFYRNQRLLIFSLHGQLNCAHQRINKLDVIY